MFDILEIIEDIEKLVGIESSTKAILVGEHIVIDGYAERSVRIVTHAHSDHVLGLRDSIYYSDYIVATPATHDLIMELGYVRNSYKPLYSKKKVSLDYGITWSYDREKITLLPVSHILGSAQVMVEYNGYRIGYTSDFKMGSETVVMKDLDVLIIEATYGHPMYRRPFKNDVVDLVIDLIEDGLKRYGRVVIYGYYGKLQEIMKILRERGVEEPFVMNKKIYSITRIAVKYGWNITNYYEIGSRDAREIISMEKHILFEHMSKAKYRKINGSVLNIVLSGHEYSEPVRRVDEYTWLAAFSDHADFDELIQYVEEAQPRYIVVDGSREGFPYVFARELRERGWKAMVLPKREDWMGF